MQAPKNASPAEATAARDALLDALELCERLEAFVARQTFGRALPPELVAALTSAVTTAADDAVLAAIRFDTATTQEHARQRDAQARSRDSAPGPYTEPPSIGKSGPKPRAR